MGGRDGEAIEGSAQDAPAVPRHDRNAEEASMPQELGQPAAGRLVDDAEAGRDRDVSATREAWVRWAVSVLEEE